MMSEIHHRELSWLSLKRDRNVHSNVFHVRNVQNYFTFADTKIIGMEAGPIRDLANPRSEATATTASVANAWKVLSP